MVVHEIPKAWLSCAMPHYGTESAALEGDLCSSWQLTNSSCDHIPNRFTIRPNVTHGMTDRASIERSGGARNQ